MVLGESSLRLITAVITTLTMILWFQIDWKILIISQHSYKTIFNTMLKLYFFYLNLCI